MEQRSSASPSVVTRTLGLFFPVGVASVQETQHTPARSNIAMTLGKMIDICFMILLVLGQRPEPGTE